MAELADRDLLPENQIKHQEKNARAKSIDRSALNEAEAPQVLHFLKLELQYFPCRAIEPFDLLLGEAKALYQLDIT